MAETSSLTCPQCGAVNDVLVPGDSFEEQLRYASFRFACRVCGQELPNARPPSPPDPPKSD